MRSPECPNSVKSSQEQQAPNSNRIAVGFGLFPLATFSREELSESTAEVIGLSMNSVLIHKWSRNWPIGDDIFYINSVCVKEAPLTNGDGYTRDDDDDDDDDDYDDDMMMLTMIDRW